jgi:hypothetical protein
MRMINKLITVLMRDSISRSKNELLGAWTEVFSDQLVGQVLTRENGCVKR